MYKNYFLFGRTLFEKPTFSVSVLNMDLVHITVGKAWSKSRLHPSTWVEISFSSWSGSIGERDFISDTYQVIRSLENPVLIYRRGFFFVRTKGVNGKYMAPELYVSCSDDPSC